MMGWDADFAERADNANLCVGIIGLGYVGLPTAIGFHDAGFSVWGVDVSQGHSRHGSARQKSHRRS